MPEQQKISAVIITKNEESNIKRCIDNALIIADEVIIIDAESSDNTEEIVKQFNPDIVHFHTRKWEGYASQKNFGFDLAKHEYILGIDADEVLDRNALNAVNNLKETGKLNGAYSFAILNNYYGSFIGKNGFLKDYKTRLFPKDGSQWLGDSVHERLEFKDNLMTSRLPGWLLHYTYTNPEDHIARVKHYAELRANDLVHKSKFTLKWKSYLSCIFRFFKIYFIQFGVLKGKNGFLAAKYTGLEAYWKYSFALKAKLHPSQEY